MNPIYFLIGMFILEVIAFFWTISPGKKRAKGEATRQTVDEIREPYVGRRM